MPGAPWNIAHSQMKVTSFTESVRFILIILSNCLIQTVNDIYKTTKRVCCVLLSIQCVAVIKYLESRVSFKWQHI